MTQTHRSTPNLPRPSGRSRWFLGVGGGLSLVLVGLVGCGQPQAQSNDAADAPAPKAEAAGETDPEAALMPDLSSGVFEAAPDPGTGNGLVPPTPADARVSSIRTGRQDPFAGILQPTARPAIAAPNSTNPTPGLPASNPLATPALAPLAPGTLPPVPVAAAPILPPLQPGAGGSNPVGSAIPAASPANSGAAPVAAAPVTPPAPALPLASRIEVRGVVQIGQEVAAIVVDPVAQSSRQVKVGDLIGGAVRVKRIDVGPNQEPLVILEQNGQEFPRSVGSSSSLNLS